MNKYTSSKITHFQFKTWSKVLQHPKMYSRDHNDGQQVKSIFHVMQVLWRFTKLYSEPDRNYLYLSMKQCRARIQSGILLWDNETDEHPVMFAQEILTNSSKYLYLEFMVWFCTFPSRNALFPLTRPKIKIPNSSNAYDLYPLLKSILPK